MDHLSKWPSSHIFFYQGWRSWKVRCLVRPGGGGCEPLSAGKVPLNMFFIYAHFTRKFAETVALRPREADDGRRPTLGHAREMLFRITKMVPPRFTSCGPLAEASIYTQINDLDGRPPRPQTRHYVPSDPVDCTRSDLSLSLAPLASGNRRSSPWLAELSLWRGGKVDKGGDGWEEGGAGMKPGTKGKMDINTEVSATIMTTFFCSVSQQPSNHPRVFKPPDLQDRPRLSEP